jgi:hypothetical protein
MIAEQMDAHQNPPLDGAVTGALRLWLRLEGLAVLGLSLILYQRAGHSWWVFALCFLLPDVSFVGYVAGPRAGAASYNVAHSYVGPIGVAAVCLLTGQPLLIALVWTAHIGFDRALGYGLKYASGFAHTHLGRIGRRGNSLQL